MDDNHSEHDRQAKETILQNIEQYGCHLALLEADSYLPAFAYTIGLCKKFNHPEIICFGLCTDLMSSLLNYAKDLVKQGEKLIPEKDYEGFLNGYPIRFIEVNKEFYSDYLGYAGWFYENFNFPALQLIWPDKEGNFPGDDDFNTEWKFLQPLLDRNTDFKFYENRNLGVYTTRQVIEGETVLFVYHNDDGDWQFHSSADPDINEGKLVSLESLVKADPTLNDIYFLEYGWKAWRNSQYDEWEYEKDSE